MDRMTRDAALDRQYRALTTAVGRAVLSGRTIIAVTGDDCVGFLHSFVTNDVKRLAVGAGCEAFVTAPQGKTLGHVLLFREEHRIVLDTAPGQARTLIEHFERYVITEDVSFADQSEALTDVLVAGPAAGSVLSSVTRQQPPLSPLAHAPAMLAGRPVVVRKVELVGRNSWLLQVARENVSDIEAALESAGAARCEAAVESVRLEAGVPLFGLDITPDNLPQEIGRNEQAISFTKGCYLGQETVARIDALGHVNRLLAGLRFTGDSIPAAGTSLFAGGQPAGRVTSAAWSPRLAAPLGLALVRRAAAKPGTVLTTEAGSEAEVVRLPLDANPTR
jgi:folate-binding protein YgfZ